MLDGLDVYQGPVGVIPRGFLAVVCQKLDKISRKAPAKIKATTHEMASLLLSTCYHCISHSYGVNKQCLMV
jgi:hypothetical protein